ncbi:MAG: class I SAM-dependent methyltransferase [Candidatus Moranbacteria bacterium]|nr:class I SAM-dependent methyltransferase [Candidatus Moranbacteria bacterium]
MKAKMTNPYTKENISEKYDSFLNYPFIKTIRRQEKKALEKFFDRHLLKKDHVFEVGAGTGFYSLDIASRVSSLVALEPSEGMSDFLKDKIERQNINNIKIVNQDFFDFSSAEKFDHVIAVGVLDYISDWQKFLERCLGLSKKTLIFTAPQKGILGQIYKIASRFEKIQIFLYNKSQLEDCLKDYEFEIVDVGLKTFLTNGLTLVACVEIN